MVSIHSPVTTDTTNTAGKVRSSRAPLGGGKRRDALGGNHRRVMTLILKPARLLRVLICSSVFLAQGVATVVAQPSPGYPAPYAPFPPEAGLATPPEAPAAPRPLASQPGLQQFFAAPILNQNSQAVMIPPAALAEGDRPLPINLATALYLSNARPLVIAFARNSVELAAAQLQRAEVMWLPNLNAGIGYMHHDGEDQSTPGQMIRDSKSSFAAGFGATLGFGISDAIFLPLAARQQLSAREFDVEAARNDALATVATAYFDVQEARGRLAGNLDAQAKAESPRKTDQGVIGSQGSGWGARAPD